MTHFRLIEAVAPGLALIETTDYRDHTDVALWSQSRMRKRTRCALMDTPLEPGNEAFRPIGNQQYRSLRLSLAAVQLLARGAEKP